MSIKETITKWQFLLSLFSFILLFVSLYQLEIVFIDMTLNRYFCFPFDIYCSNEYWIIRDIWYTTIILAFFMLLYAIWKYD